MVVVVVVLVTFPARFSPETPESATFMLIPATKISRREAGRPYRAALAGSWGLTPNADSKHWLATVTKYYAIFSTVRYIIDVKVNLIPGT